MPPRLPILVPLLLAACLGACGPKYAITETRTAEAIGEGSVEIVVHEAEAPGLTFVNLHDNENTAVEAALKAIGEHGGRLIELRHSGERNISFPLAESLYVFDPNRIFTDAGAAATLADLGPISPPAHAEVRRFAEAFLARLALDSLSTVVAVHNNTDAQYSLLSYLSGDYRNDALAVYLADKGDPDDFFFVTNVALYDALRDAAYNVVVQDNARVTDDGSLSVYCGYYGIPYVNVEAEHGHRGAQVEMIEALLGILAPEAPPEAPPPSD